MPNKKLKSGKRKVRGERKRGVYLIKGTILGLSIFSVLLCISAIIITNSDFDADKYSLFLQIILPVAAFFSAFFAGLKSKLKGITAGLLQTVVFIVPVTLILLAANKFSIGLSDLLFIPISLVAGAAAGIISANIKR